MNTPRQATRFEGALDVDGAPALFRSMPRHTEPALDLSAVTRCDSAGLALLLEYRRRAGGHINLHNVPEQARTLIDFYRLGALLHAAD